MAIDPIELLQGELKAGDPVKIVDRLTEYRRLTGEKDVDERFGTIEEIRLVRTDAQRRANEPGRKVYVVKDAYGFTETYSRSRLVRANPLDALGGMA